MIAGERVTELSKFSLPSKQLHPQALVRRHVSSRGLATGCYLHIVTNAEKMLPTARKGVLTMKKWGLEKNYLFVGASGAIYCKRADLIKFSYLSRCLTVAATMTHLQINMYIYNHQSHKIFMY